MAGLLTVVRVLEFDGWDVAAGLEQAAVVEPVDVLQSGDLDLLDRPPGPAGLDQFGLEQPITDSASALSNASPTDPIDESIPASARRSVNAIEVYYPLRFGQRLEDHGILASMGRSAIPQLITDSKSQHGPRSRMRLDPSSPAFGADSCTLTSAKARCPSGQAVNFSCRSVRGRAAVHGRPIMAKSCDLRLERFGLLMPAEGA